MHAWIYKLVEDRRKCQAITMIWLGLGFSWLVMSNMLGLHQLAFQGREVGYFMALNWSLVYIVILPFLLFFSLELVRESRGLLSRMVRKQMFINLQSRKLQSSTDLQNATIDKLQDNLMRHMKTPIRIWMWLVVLALIFSMKEWWSNSARWLLLYDFTSMIEHASDNPELELDWMVGELLKPEPKYFMQVLNAIFTFFLFVFAQTVIISAGLFILIYSAGYSFFLWNYKNSEDGQLAIIPSLASSDRRFGFELFESYASNLIRLCILLLAALILIVTVNEYIHDVRIDAQVNAAQNGEAVQTEESVVSFLFKPFAHLYSDISSRQLTPAFLQVLFRPFTPNQSSTYAVIAGAIVILCIFVMVLVIPSWLAKSSRDNLLGMKGKVIENAGIKESDEMMRYLSMIDRGEMQVWPYQWISLNGLLLCAACMFSLLFFPHMVPALFLGIIVYIFQAIIRDVTREWKRLA